MGAAEGWEAQCHLSACAGQWNQTSKAGWILLPFPKLESIDPLTSGGQAHEALKNRVKSRVYEHHAKLHECLCEHDFQT